MGLLRRLRAVSDDNVEAATFPGVIYSEDFAAESPELAAAFGLTPTTSWCERVSRNDAMTIPALRQGRQVIAGTIGAQPLICTRGPELEPIFRQLLDQPDPRTTRQWMLTWTVDDLLFNGISWWRVLDRDGTGYPVSAERIRKDRVLVELSSSTVYIDGKPQDDANLIRFDGPDEGLLATSGRSLRTCLLLESAVRRNADGLPPLDLLTPEDGAGELSQTEIDDLLAAWLEARRTKSTAFLNRALKHQSVGYDAAAATLNDARNYQAAEVARMLNLRPRYVNAQAGDTTTYTNVQAERLDLTDITYAPYLEAIGQRLSLGDVTPRGQVVRVDMSGFLRGDEKTAVETTAAAKAAGFLTADEGRARVYHLPPLNGAT